jgi:hypothetical protein
MATNKPGIRPARGGQRTQQKAEMDQLSNSITNEQLVEEFSEQIESGLPFIFHIKETVNPDFQDVYIAQARTIKRAANVNSATTQRPLSKLEIQLKGFDNLQIIRHRDVYSPAALEKMGWKEGTILEGTMISVMDSVVPRDDVQAARPRANTDGFVLLSAGEGLPIYRHTGLYDADDCPPDHVIDFEVSETTVEEFADQIEMGEEAAV